MDYSPKQRLAIVAVVVLTLAAAILLMSCGGSNGINAAALKGGKIIQTALGAYETKEGSYPSELTRESVTKVLVDEWGGPYLMIPNQIQSFSDLGYRHIPYSSETGGDSYRAYLGCPGEKNVVFFTPDSIKVVPAEVAKTWLAQQG